MWAHYVLAPIAGMRLSYEAIQYPMKVMHLLMFLEILHAVTGIVKSNLFSSIIQVRLGFSI